MKYWLLTTEFPPFYGGGIATYCLHTARMFAERGHEVTVFCSDHSLEKDIEIEMENNYRVVRFKPGVRVINKYLGSPASLSYEFSEIIEEFIKREGQPTIIESQEYLGLPYYILQKKYTLMDPFKDLKIIVTTHTPKFICDLYNHTPIYRFPNFWTMEMEKFSIKASDEVISPSYFLVKELKKYVDNKLEINVIPNPFSIDEKKDDEIYGQRRDVVFVGRLERRKGILELLRFMRRLWEEGYEFPLTLIGGDTFYQPKGRMMGEFIFEKYKFFFREGFLKYEGKLSPAVLFERLKKAKVAIFPSLIENYPYTVIELLHSGVIVLASDTGGHAEIIEDGISGFIYSNHDYESFKSKLLTILRLTEGEQSILRKNAFERIKNLSSYENVYQKKMEVIDKALKKGRAKTFPFLREIEKRSAEIVLENIKTKKGLLSVIIPYYNMGDYVEETVDSVKKNLYRPIEIIIVNDGSDDPKSLEVLESLKKKEEVIILNKPNGGLASARNEGALNASGEYIAFLDADDLVAPEYYKLAVELLEHYQNISFVGCWTEYFENGSGIWITFNPEPPYFLFHNSVNSSGLVLRKADFLHCGINDPRLEYGMEDYDYVMNMLKHGYRGVVIPLPLFKYRVRKGSMLRQFTPMTYLFLYQLITEKHRDFYKEYGDELFNLLNANGPAYLIDNPTWEYPLIGFVPQANSLSDGSFTAENIIPYELKERLKKLWSNKFFRSAVTCFFKLKLDKLLFK